MIFSPKFQIQMQTLGTLVKHQLCDIMMAVDRQQEQIID